MHSDSLAGPCAPELMNFFILAGILLRKRKFSPQTCTPPRDGTAVQLLDFDEGVLYEGVLYSLLHLRLAAQVKELRGQLRAAHEAKRVPEVVSRFLATTAEVQLQQPEVTRRIVDATPGVAGSDLAKLNG
jgi:hypothetical protein